MMDKDSKLISESYLLVRESHENEDENEAAADAFMGAMRDLRVEIENESEPGLGRLADMLYITHHRTGEDFDFSVIPHMLSLDKQITCPKKQKKLAELHKLMDGISHDRGGPRPLRLRDWGKIAKALKMNGTPMNDIGDVDMDRDFTPKSHTIPPPRKPEGTDLGDMGYKGAGAYERERLNPRHGGVPRSP